MPSILVVDDTRATLKAMDSIFRQEGYEVYTADSGQGALLCVQEHDIDLLFSDVNMPRMNGIELLKTLKAQHPGIVVVMISGVSAVNVAANAIREGAFDYLVKPLSKDDILRTTHKALTLRALMVENLSLKQQVRDQFERAEVIGSSNVWRQVHDLVLQVAAIPCHCPYRWGERNGKRTRCDAPLPPKSPGRETLHDPQRCRLACNLN